MKKKTPLEEYRDNIIKQTYPFADDETFPLHEDQKHNSWQFTAGFSCAIALNLPVKFAEWKDNESSFHFGMGLTPYLFDGKYWGREELYQYWIENVYKPE